MRNTKKTVSNVAITKRIVELKERAGSLASEIERAQKFINESIAESNGLIGAITEFERILTSQTPEPTETLKV